MSRVVIKPDFAYANNKAQISLAVTASLILSFVFATQIILLFTFTWNLTFKLLVCFIDCTGRFVSYLVGNPEDRLSRVAAQLFYIRDFDTNHRKITNAKGCGSICWDSTNVNGLE